ncbi:MAG: DoxX family protein [Verrucomicrobiae bacterium]|nr:DoxX family protein [Verrucomicrobiae bacterium]
MKPFFNGMALERLGRAALAGVFLYAAILKIREPLDFADAIDGFQILSARWINLLALALPWLEALTALLLFAPLRRMALGMTLALTVLFGVALSSAMFRGLAIDCGCFGPSVPHALPYALARDAFLFVLAGALWWRELKR